MITTSFTWPATTNAIMHTGATPVFADVDAGTLNLDPACAGGAGRRAHAGDPAGALRRRRLRHGRDRAAGRRRTGWPWSRTPRTRSRRPSATAGWGRSATSPASRCTPPRASPAARAASSPPTPSDGRRLLRLLRAQGITRDPWRRQQERMLGHYDVALPGFKANLADLQAAVALPKFDRLGSLYESRAAAGAAVRPRAWRSCPGSSRSRRPGSAAMPTTCTWCGSTADLAGADRDRYAAALMAENISTGLHFLPVHTLTWYREHLRHRLAARDRGGRRHGAVAAAGRRPQRAGRGRCAGRAAQAARRLHGMSRRWRVALGAAVSAVVLAALLWFTDPAADLGRARRRPISAGWPRRWPSTSPRCR